jgi:GR25 family glycosyltransferase involved in LPS biosynthesis
MDIDVIYINLATARGRNESFLKRDREAMLLPESWRLHRFAAVDKESAEAEPTPSTVPPAVKGNYLSHLGCARLARRFGPHVVIAEDDTVFCNLTAFWLERLIDTLPEDSWDVILTDIYVADATRMPRLLKTRRRCLASNTIDLFAAAAWEGAFVGAGSYVINRRAKDKFLATLALPEIAHAFDLCLRQAMLTDQLKGIITSPFLTTILSEGDDSSVQPEARIWEATLYHCFRRLVWIGAENLANQVDRVPPQLPAVPDALVDSEVEALAAIMRPLLPMQMNWP